MIVRVVAIVAVLLRRLPLVDDDDDDDDDPDSWLDRSISIYFFGSCTLALSLSLSVNFSSFLVGERAGDGLVSYIHLCVCASLLHRAK